MKIEVSPEQRDILKHLLEREIAETGPELRHTRTSEYHDELKVYERKLLALIERVESAEAA